MNCSEYTIGCAVNWSLADCSIHQWIVLRTLMLGMNCTRADCSVHQWIVLGALLEVFGAGPSGALQPCLYMACGPHVNCINLHLYGYNVLRKSTLIKQNSDGSTASTMSFILMLHVQKIPVSLLCLKFYKEIDVCSSGLWLTTFQDKKISTLYSQT